MMDARTRAIRYAQAALDQRCRDLAMARCNRNRLLNEAAHYLAGFIAAGYLDRTVVENALFAASQANGYVAKDGAQAARATIRSGATAGLLTPRDPPEHGRCGRRYEPDPAAAARLQELAREAEDEARADAAERKRLAAWIWSRGQDPRGTIVESYLRSRGLDLPDEVAVEALRFVERCPWGKGTTAPAMTALMRDVRTGEPQAIHRTALTLDGCKVGRRMLADARGCAVMLDGFESITTGLAAGEGIESCLAARQMGVRPCWATCSTSILAKLPVLPGIESLSLLAENDPNGASDRACAETASRWHEAGRPVDLVRPPAGLNDMNDLIREAVPA